jgi:electron transport complex protein RnfE
MNRLASALTDGLWRQNVVFAQMLALCPAMAVTTSGTNGLGMGLATTAVLITSNVLVASIRSLVSPQVRIPIFVVLIASLVTLVDLGLNAWLHDLYKVLGLFIALIVVNCAILGRAEAYASKNTVVAAAVDGLAMGLGFTVALTLIGLIRELLGSATLFAQASLLLGPAFRVIELTVIPDYGGFLLMVLPPEGSWSSVSCSPASVPSSCAHSRVPPSPRCRSLPERNPAMQIGVAYSEAGQQIWLNIEVPDASTVREVIDRSGILRSFPTIDLATQKVGVFGRLVKLDAALRPGDRIEIYRAITCDPQTVPRRDGAGDDDE